jgi:inositol-1,3,4-trisphosphate 5/6-kinase / inositol-tetrakisphosphate 1-kinase
LPFPSAPLAHSRRDSAARMRLHAEVRDEMEEGSEEGAVTASAGLSPPPLIGAAAPVPRLVVGFALTKKKVKSFLQPKLLLLAR